MLVAQTPRMTGLGEWKKEIDDAEMAAEAEGTCSSSYIRKQKSDAAGQATKTGNASSDRCFAKSSFIQNVMAESPRTGMMRNVSNNPKEFRLGRLDTQTQAKRNLQTCLRPPERIIDQNVICVIVVLWLSLPEPFIMNRLSFVQLGKTLPQHYAAAARYSSKVR